jgi:hypothetical protein
MKEKLKILIYKRTHDDDPDVNGCFGINDCMGTVRNWNFYAVIGIGGIGNEPHVNGISGTINWIGIGPQKTNVRGKPRRPLVTFDHFRKFISRAPDLRRKAPKLAKRMYDRNVRRVMNSLTAEEYKEALAILDMARDAPPSPKRNHLKGSRTGKC